VSKPKEISDNGKKLCFPYVFYTYIFNTLFPIYFSPLFSIIFSKTLWGVSYNIPAVYDVFASPIKETVRFPGLAKTWVEWSVGGVADLAKRIPSRLLAAKRKQTC
jgi:hypothetical protein